MWISLNYPSEIKWFHTIASTVLWLRDETLCMDNLFQKRAPVDRTISSSDKITMKEGNGVTVLKVINKSKSNKLSMSGLPGG